MIRTNPTPNVDGSIAIQGSGGPSAPLVGVGILATDAQHGNRGGGALHALATTLVEGFMSATDKSNLDGIVAGLLSGSAFYGDGADGAVSIGTAAVTQPLTRATTFHATGNVTPQATKNGMIIRATTSVEVDGGASINADGLGTAGAAGGAAGANGGSQVAAVQTQLVANPAQVLGGVLGTGGAAGAVGNNGSAPLATGNVLQGGPGGGGGGGGGGTVAAGSNGGTGGQEAAGNAFDSYKWAKARWDPLLFTALTNASVVPGVGGAGGAGGGAGGGGGGAGGAGGSGVTATGGGIVFIASPVFTGTGRISANGTVGVAGANGSNSGAQGGGGGGAGSGGGAGGVVVLVTKSLGGGLTVQANGGALGAGGTGGTGGAGAGNGGNGGNGAAGGAGSLNTIVLA
jgi:hypothetical protein